MTRACLVFGCGDPVTTRGRCARHAAQVDSQRSLGTDRQVGAALYATRQWQELRAMTLALHPFCMCAECVVSWRRWPSTVVHHRDAHGGDPAKFFDPSNLLAMAKTCHDRLTARARGKQFVGANRSDKTALACPSSGRGFGPRARRHQGGSRG